MQGLAIFLVALVAVAGCAIFGSSERADIANHANVLEQCQEVGRQGPDGGHIKAYDACLKEAGVR